MNIVSVSSYDPIFWYHHSFVDYLYTEWEVMVEYFVKGYMTAERLAVKNYTPVTADEVLLKARDHYPSWFFDIGLSPVEIWYKTAGEAHLEVNLYQRSERLLSILSNHTTTSL
jgi:hypothetical protein